MHFMKAHQQLYSHMLYSLSVETLTESTSVCVFLFSFLRIWICRRMANLVLSVFKISLVIDSLKQNDCKRVLSLVKVCHVQGFAWKYVIKEQTYWIDLQILHCNMLFLLIRILVNGSSWRCNYCICESVLGGTIFSLIVTHGHTHFLCMLIFFVQTCVG